MEMFRMKECLGRRMSNRRWVASVGFAFMFCIGAASAHAASKPATIRFHGIRKTDPMGAVGLANPDRGFRYETRIGEDEKSTEWMFTPSKAVIAQVPPSPMFTDDRWILGMGRIRPFGVTVMQAYCYLSEFNDRPISAHKLALLQRSLDRIRRRGYKALLRFAYEKDMRRRMGAKPEWMLRHIKQLEPILRQNADVILAMYAGFIGAWGEWHSDRYIDAHDYVTRGKILRALFDAIPKDCPVLMRTPEQRRKVLRSPYMKDRAEEYAGRMGIDNDGFLAGPTDGGTFFPKAAPGCEEFDRFTAISHKLLIDGELFWSNLIQTPTRQVQAKTANDALNAAIRLRLHHYTTFSLTHSYSDFEGKNFAIDWWMIERITEADLRKSKMPISNDYFRDSFDNKVARSGFEYIRDHLGYRLELQTATFPRELTAGETLFVRLTLINRGFAAPVRKRPVRICLIDLAGNVFPVEVKGVDPRKWQPFNPGDSAFAPITHTLTGQVPIPADMKAGWYQLGVWLPDSHERIQLDARYAIRFANRDINWWVTADRKYGINLLGMVKIDE